MTRRSLLDAAVKANCNVRLCTRFVNAIKDAQDRVFGMKRKAQDSTRRRDMVQVTISSTGRGSCVFIGRCTEDAARRPDFRRRNHWPSCTPVYSGCYAVMTHAKLTDTDLTMADFDDVNLGNACFHNVNLSGVIIFDANLSRLTDTGANLSDVQIQDADLTGLQINGILVADLCDAYEKSKS
ncbi:MAG: pentapeptide repeat-containing protein [Pseudomonadota bacterium]